MICDEDPRAASEVVRYGASQTLIDDLRKHTRGVNILTSYLGEILEVISKICKHDEGLVRSHSFYINL